MGISTVASPANSDIRPSDRRGESPSVRRADGGGHLGGHTAGKAWTPERLRPDSDLILQRPGAKWPPTMGDRR
jgi:hypothetical protein